MSIKKAPTGTSTKLTPNFNSSTVADLGLRFITNTHTHTHGLGGLDVVWLILGI